MRAFRGFLSWFSKRPRLVRIVLVLLAFGAVAYFMRWHNNSNRMIREVSAEVLEEYESELLKRPFDGPLLLRGARHIYYLVRNKRLQNNNEIELKDLMERGLSYYRRILSHSDWQLQSDDYFYSAYLYYQLANIYSYDLRYIYSERAKEMALRAYEMGYRSPELIALLANLHYENGEYEIALGYFDSLGQALSDPVLLLNKSRTLLGRGEPEDLKAASEVLARAERNMDDRDPNMGLLREHYRRTRIRLALAEGDLPQAHRLITARQNWRDDVNYQVLYAEFLLRRGQRENARKILTELKKQESYPPRVDNLLNDF